MFNLFKKHENSEEAELLRISTNNFIVGKAEFTVKNTTTSFHVQKFCTRLSDCLYQKTQIANLLSGVNYRIYAGILEIKLKYRYGINNTLEIIEKSNRALKLAKSITQSSGVSTSGDYEKSLWIYKIILKMTEYDYSARGRTGDDIPAYPELPASNYCGVFLENKAICRGVAESVKLLAGLLSLKCDVVLGQGKNQDGWESHAWNIILLDGENYFIDVTYDLENYNNNEITTYEHFNINTKTTRYRHRWDEEITGGCTALRANYFTKTRSLINVANIKEFIELNKNKSQISFKYLGQSDKAERNVLSTAENLFTNFKYYHIRETKIIIIVNQ